MDGGVLADFKHKISIIKEDTSPENSCNIKIFNSDVAPKDSGPLCCYGCIAESYKVHFCIITKTSSTLLMDFFFFLSIVF
jgi:hypothetical protein